MNGRISFLWKSDKDSEELIKPGIVLLLFCVPLPYLRGDGWQAPIIHAAIDRQMTAVFKTWFLSH
jgi:hypothetical protein